MINMYDYRVTSAKARADSMQRMAYDSAIDYLQICSKMFLDLYPEWTGICYSKTTSTKSYKIGLVNLKYDTEVSARASIYSVYVGSPHMLVPSDFCISISDIGHTWAYGDFKSPKFASLARDVANIENNLDKFLLDSALSRAANIIITRFNVYKI